MRIEICFSDDAVVTSSARTVSPEMAQLAPYSIRLEATKMLEDVLARWEANH